MTRHARMLGLIFAGLIASADAIDSTCEAGASACPSEEESALVQTRIGRHSWHGDTPVGLDHRNFGGHNLDQGVSMGTWYPCASSCTTDSECKAWTFVYHEKKCYKKSTVDKPMQQWSEDNDVISMYKPGHIFKDLEGADHKNFDGTNINPDGYDTHTWENCADLCGKTTSPKPCIAWTFVYNGRCYLKSTMDEQMQDWREDRDTISGFPISTCTPYSPGCCAVDISGTRYCGPEKGSNVQCNFGSNACAGNQCCPRATETNDETYNCPSAAADFEGCELKPYMASPFMKYPASTTTLHVQGKVYASNGGKNTVKIMWNLEGVDAKCLKGAADSIKNGCGIHIHEGKTCDTDAGVGGHYYNQNTMSDPWLAVKYATTGSFTNGKSDGYASVDIGYEFTTTMGRAMVVHDFNGKKVACALLH